MNAFLICLLLALAGSAQAQDGCKSKFQDYTSRSGYKVREVSPCKVWVASDALTIPRTGGLQGLLLIAQSEDTGIMGTVVQVKARLNLSPELMLKLLKLNHEIEFAKVGIDNDGDLFLRSEVNMKTLTEEEFKAMVKNLIEASARVYATLAR